MICEGGGSAYYKLPPPSARQCKAAAVKTKLERGIHRNNKTVDKIVSIQIPETSDLVNDRFKLLKYIHASKLAMGLL